MGVLKGVHHIAVKPTKEKYGQTVDLYTGVLGMEVKMKWGDPEYPCLMVSCGDNTCMEILCGEAEAPAGGPLAHIAFATDKVDEIIAAVREKGYEVTKEPADLELGGMPIRIAFFMGPTHEEIELFWEE